MRKCVNVSGFLSKSEVDEKIKNSFRLLNDYFYFLKNNNGYPNRSHLYGRKPKDPNKLAAPYGYFVIENDKLYIANKCIGPKVVERPQVVNDIYGYLKSKNAVMNDYKILYNQDHKEMAEMREITADTADYVVACILRNYIEDLNTEFNFKQYTY
jgi:hypothetical protein